MTDPRNDDDKAWDNNKIDIRHSAEEAESQSQLIDDWKENPSALAARYGVDTASADLADLAHEEVMQLRRSIAEDIENCRCFDDDDREVLASDLRSSDPNGPNPAEPFVEILHRFRELARSNPYAVMDYASAIDGIERDLQYLIGRARASALD